MTKENDSGIEPDKDQVASTHLSTTASPDSDDPYNFSRDVPPKKGVIDNLEYSPISYDARPHEDSARRRIAYSLIGLLWFVIGAMFALIALELIAVADIKDFAVVLGPVVTLVSAATGFYYGTKSTTPTK